MPGERKFSVNTEFRRFLVIAGLASLALGLAVSAHGFNGLRQLGFDLEPPGDVFLMLGVVGAVIAALGAVCLYFSRRMRFVRPDATEDQVETVQRTIDQFARALAPVTCPSCRAAKSGEAKHCAGCGKPLPRRACPRCGGCADIDANFCKTCGAALEADPGCS